MKRQETFETKQPMLVKCHSGRVYIYVNETEVKETVRRQTGEETYEDVEVTRYRYDVDDVVPVSQTDEGILDALIDQVKGYISEYDKSDKVNVFYINGKKMEWLYKNDRSGLQMRLEAEKANGIEQTTLWSGLLSFHLAVDDADKMRVKLEIYAANCFDNTASHTAAVEAYRTVTQDATAESRIQSVMDYDYTVGYPEAPDFPIS